MKTFIPLLALLGSIVAILNAADDGGEEDLKRIQITELSTLLDGEEAIMIFEVGKTYWISGSVPRGNARSFGIEPLMKEPNTRISLLVIGELADAMERFGYAPPRPGDPLAGARIEARGKVHVHPAPKKAPEKGPSYQFRISDLKGFRIVSRAE